MDSLASEVMYPLSFREKEAHILGENLEQRNSVELVGMKRVGIHNFLRFFLFHKDIKKAYLPQGEKDFFIFVDLNDLIERDLFPFWRLTLKRIVDAVEVSTLSEEMKEKISHIFLACIQSGDFFLTYDGVREALANLSKDVYPTLFFSRFDRMKDAVSPEFFDNLQSLKNATNQKLAYVFTSFRELDKISSSVFAHKSHAAFSKVMYLHPANTIDTKTILMSVNAQYKQTLSQETIQTILELSGGHAQYLQLACIILAEQQHKKKNLSEKECKALISEDERITLLSEELWESLDGVEQGVLKKVAQQKRIMSEEKEEAKYLWDTGFIFQQKGNNHIFSPLFAEYTLQRQEEKESSTIELSKKEHALFSLLQEKINDICEREVIVEKVWPEYKVYGVSDWTIDRLVARVRMKLRKQKSAFEIITIRTRGYKLASIK